MKPLRSLLVLLMAFAAGNASSITRYVDVSSTNSVAPYTSWATAANVIQDAVDAADPGDEVMVTNGVYDTGGRVVGWTLTNRVVINKAIQMRSVNGPEFTTITGYQVPGATNGNSAVRCVYLAEGAVLDGFTLTGGGALSLGPTAEMAGAGVWCESTNAWILNCLITSNIVINSLDGVGGGVRFGSLSNCTLIGNSAAAGGGAAGSIVVGCQILQNRATRSGGGAASCQILDSVLAGNSAVNGGAAANSMLIGCVVTNNVAGNQGGGATGGTLLDCELKGNRAGDRGGAASFSSLSDCRIIGNSALTLGGGVYSSQVTNCLVAANFAQHGGGANGGFLANCEVVGNVAYYSGGGVCSNSAINSALIENKALETGGGALASVLINCTVAGNTGRTAGGTMSSIMTNCIVFFNDAKESPNHSDGTFHHSCTVPIPTAGAGNLELDPQLVGKYRLSEVSPCIGAGAPTATGLDVDGEAWLSPPSMGCDEFVSTSTGAPPVATLSAEHAGSITGFPLRITLTVDGHATANEWDFGDGTLQTNLAFATHAYATAGVFTVTVHVFSTDFPQGVSDSIQITVDDEPVHYVSLDSQNPTPPFLSWTTAATNIQDAVDAAFPGGLVLVTNGVYRHGGHSVFGDLTNRVAVLKPLELRSVNGPLQTVIEGLKSSGSLNGTQAIRGVYLTEGSTLEGFTVTNGATRSFPFLTTAELERSGGGVWCQSTNVMVRNCVIVSNSCERWGAGVFSGTVINSQISSNRNDTGAGGGVAFSTVFDSTIAFNRAVPHEGGGGAFSAILSNCVLRANNDGAAYCSLFNCQIDGNSGPGVSGGTAFDSRIFGNLGGGAISATLSNCFIFDNRASSGGGTYNCLLTSCTISNNYATSAGGGVYWTSGGILPPSPYFPPLPNPGQSNIVVANATGGKGGGFYAASGVQSLTNWSFISNSATNDGGGFGLYANGTWSLYDCHFEGNKSGGSGGGAYAGYSVTCINSTFSNNVADANGGGAYGVVLMDCQLSGNQALNGGGVHGGIGPNGGIVANSSFIENTALLNGGGSYLNNNVFLTNNTFTANVAANGGGAYISSGTVSNCVFVANSAQTNGGGLYAAFSTMVRDSVLTANRAQFGGGGHSGVYFNCLITDNWATNSGGGVFTQPVPTPVSTNCIIRGNVALTNGGGVVGGGWERCRFEENRAESSGGAGYNCTIQNSIIADNSATLGGGVHSSRLTQCLLTGNRAETGGAVHNSNIHPVNNCTIVGNVATNSSGGIQSTPGMQLNSSIVYFNVAPLNENYSGQLNNYCCLTPLPATGIGNISDDPMLADFSSGNFRLQTGSPCINAGSANPGNSDLDGRPRVVGGRIDIGAYEYQGEGISEFTHWLQQYGLPTNGSADFAHSDADPHNNWQEWRTWTDPTDELSYLRMLNPEPGANGTVVSWRSEAGHSYFVERASDAGGSFLLLQSNITGQAGVTSLADPNAIGAGPFLYRVGVSD